MTTPNTDTTTAKAAAAAVTAPPTGPTFALVGLPETVKAALFARYSRSPMGARELLAAEFGGGEAEAADDRAEALHRRVLDEYGDDSVAQLGSAHVACEGVSNVLTKVIERGRLMSYLKKSTRYVPFDRRPDGT